MRILTQATTSSINNANSKQKPAINNQATVTDATDDSNNAAPTGGGNLEQQIRASRKRWAILFGICAFGFLNGIVNELSPILMTMVKLLGIKLDEYIYLSQLFSYLAPAAAFPTAWFVDKFGLRCSMHAFLLLVTLRNSSRMLLFSPQLAHWTNYKFIYWLLAGSSETLVVIFYCCLPLKISENWFPRAERSFAWGLMCVFPLFGSATSAFMVPRYVTDVPSTYLLARVNLVALILSLIVVVSCITHSKPKNPPSERPMAKETQLASSSLINDLRKLTKERNLLIHLLVLRTFDALISSAIGSVLTDVLAASGLSQQFAGQFSALTSMVSAVCLLFGATRVDKRQSKMKDGCEKSRSARTCKICVSLMSLSGLLYCTTLSLRHSGQQMGWLAMITAGIYTALRSWSAPRFMQLSAQLIVGTITEATYAAMEHISGCFLSTGYTFIFVYLRREEGNQVDYSYSLFFSGVLITLTSFVYICSFRVRKSAEVSDHQASGRGRSDDREIITEPDDAISMEQN